MNYDFPFLCFDTEDNSKELMEQVKRGVPGVSGFDKKVTQIAAITAQGKRYYSPGNVADFKRWLLQQPEQFIYALNVKYDLGALFGDKLDELDQTLVGGRVIKAVWGKKIFVDVFNIWPMSVKKLGEAFGLQKLETESMATDKDYVFRDTEIIRQAMLFAWQFVEHLGLEHLKATLGGLCVSVWQEWDGSNCHDSTVLSREALFGGRVELFKQTNESNHICYTDINSLYPSVMRNQFPGPLEQIKTRKCKLPKWGIATATVEVPETPFCPLPYRRQDGMVFYPWGKFTGTWTVLELEQAAATGTKIVKIKDCWGTNESMQPYQEFVERLYAARLVATSEAERLFFKLLMNNLYGRLGTTGKIGRTVWQTPKNRNHGVPFGDRVLVTYQMPLAEETNWSHAAYITAYGRLQLLEFMRRIGGDKMIYCDTDSCIFDVPDVRLTLGQGNPVLPETYFQCGSDLGQMKLVGWERHCETFAPKMYHIGQTWKAKGVPVRLAKEFIQQGHVEYDLPFNMREAIAFFDRGNARKLGVWHTVRKERKTPYDKKKLIGNRYFPCKINAV